jgi:pyrroline-5-carboxylate reductase
MSSMRAAGPTVVIVGAGNLGGAVAAGLLSAAAVAPERLRCVTASDASAAALRTRLGEGVDVTTDAVAAVRGADVVMVGVKPYAVAGVLADLAAAGAIAPGAVVVSLAAGVTLAVLAAAVPVGVPVVRLMTNTPVRVRAATTILSAPVDTDAAVIAQVVALADALGTTHVLEEGLMDAATALAGSGPAYLFLLVECLRDAGVALGLTPDAAVRMATTAMAGAARLLDGGSEDPVALRAAVTSPGGMTAAAVEILEDAGLRAAVTDALAAAVARAAELAAG